MKLVSVLGDSISTYEGYNPPGYAVYCDEKMQKLNQLNTVYDTWWAKVNQALHAFLCVNNSYSGSKVTGTGFPSGACVERLRCLKTAEHSPDLILIFLGFNDFGTGITARAKKHLFFSDRDAQCFETAYGSMIKTIRSYYPHTQIICGTLLRTRIKDRDDWVFPECFAGTALEEYNDAIRDAVKKQDCLLADIALSDVRYETLDGSHPTALGHQEIARAWIESQSCSGLL